MNDYDAKRESVFRERYIQHSTPPPDSLWILGSALGYWRIYHYVLRVEVREHQGKQLLLLVSPCQYKYHGGRPKRLADVHVGGDTRLCQKCSDGRMRYLMRNPDAEEFLWSAYVALRDSLTLS